ncbi:1,4-dihydroxy-2-naphthoate octaprenyltransferase [Providencia alcalifaciens]|nr:1,4-dihydroxy-2-naphthoate octaprenyltransferase [Providencia alcalifaciens]
MKILFSIALTTAILSSLWAWIANSFGLIGWIGFLGCTSYFAYPKDGVKGLLITFLTVISGVIFGLIIIHSSAYLNDSSSIFEYVITGIIAFLMCIQAKNAWLSYIPGTFIGACAIFGAEGDWSTTILSLVIGIAFGFSMKRSSLWLSEKW